jgi:hypothetical protein
MKPTKRFLWGAGSAAVAVLALTLVVPRAAHAIVATLVNVVNTAAAPAVTQDVSKLASQNVLLWNASGDIVPHSAAALYQISNGVTAPSAFVVPAGQSFVVTTVDFTPASSAAIYVGIGAEELVLQQSGTTATVQYQFPSGIVFPAGSTVGISDYGLSPAAIVYVYVHGYLTSN